MYNHSADRLKKSKTSYRNLHRGISPNSSISHRISLSESENSNDETEHYHDYRRTNNLPIFVNRFFFSKPKKNLDTGVFRAVRGQVIIHHDDERSSKVQSEDLDRSNDHDENELQSLTTSRTNPGNYELHYDVDNPLEISCSMSLSSAETVSDYEPSPKAQKSLININGKQTRIQSTRTPLETSDNEEDNDDRPDADDDSEKTPSSLLSDDDSSNIKDPFTSIDDNDDNLNTFHGWHMSMLKQIDEKLKEIEKETIDENPSVTNEPSTTRKDKEPSNKIPTSSHPQRKHFRPHFRRRFEKSNVKGDRSPLPISSTHESLSQTNPVKKESRTLIINLPASSSSDEDDDSPSIPIPEPIHIRIVPSSKNNAQKRSQSSERLSLRDQAAQTEPTIQNRRLSRPASVNCERIQNSQSLTRTNANQFLQQKQLVSRSNNFQTVQPAKFYSLRNCSSAPRQSIVNQIPMNQKISQQRSIIPRQTHSTIVNPPVSRNPLVYANDYGHVQQMDTSNLGSLVNRVFDDICQEKASDFYRDYHQLLNDIQIQFSMMKNFESQPVVPVHHQPSITGTPNPSVFHTKVSSFPSKFNNYSTNSSASLCDTLIYIPHAH